MTHSLSKLVECDEEGLYKCPFCYGEHFLITRFFRFQCTECKEIFEGIY